MKTLLFLVTAVVALVLVTSSPINTLSDLTRHERVMFNKSPQYRKEQHMGVKGYNPPTPPFVDLRKGEFMCGNRVCKLRPGEVPLGCNGVCQYPVK